MSVEGELRAEGKTKHCMVKDGKIVSIPREVREKLATETKA